MASKDIRLSTAERTELETRSRSANPDGEDARRARLVLLLAQQLPYRSIQEILGCSEHFVVRWKRRFLGERLAGLYSRHAGRQSTDRSRQLQAQAVAAIEARTHREEASWSTRGLAQELGTHHMLVARAWAKACPAPPKPPASPPAGERPAPHGAAEILGLYVKPPQHAAVFSSFQGESMPDFDRVDRLILISLGQSAPAATRPPGRALQELEELLDRGDELGRSAGRHTSAELVAFLSEITLRHPSGPIELIADNAATARGPRMRRFLAEHPGTLLEVVPNTTAWLSRVASRIAEMRSEAATSVAGRAHRADRLLDALRRASAADLGVKWLLERTS